MALPTSPYVAATYVCAALITYVVIQAAYNLVLHPLSRYPGPFWAKVTDAYGGYHAARLSLPQITQRDLKQYGPVIRHGPNRLVFSSTKAIQDIYNNPRVTKSTVYLVTLSTLGEVCAFNAQNREVHKSRRKILALTTTERNIRQYEPTLSEQTNIFLKHILDASQSKDGLIVSEPLGQLGADIISLLAFGYPLNVQTDTTYRFVPESITLGNGINNVKMQFPFLSNSIFSFITDLLTHAQLRRFYKLTDLIVSTRLSSDMDGHADLFSLAADKLKNDKNFKIKDLWAEALFLFSAGGETTATAICGVLFYLSRYPHAYEKLATEIREVFSAGDEICYGPKIASCRYLRACIDEALRVSSPVSGTLWRQLSNEEDHKQPFIVDGHVVPPKTHVGVNIYAMHHDEDYFPEPYTYKPERWLDADADTRRRMNEAFLPFSVGARSCSGKPFAYFEASLIVAKMLWYFDFEKTAGEAGEMGGGTAGAPYGRHREKEFQLYDIFSSMQEGPSLTFHTRGDFWQELVTENKQ
ncbi:hypothetical protein S40285_02520 [Stachybotrys chlorohalonatus IBT 40285]|uniref:Cytochrome P450 n=1 Tax=Stachybotrys chlorohalonatus (strain IBT 40285) TaxID=1283841 RepID=A0A084QWQ8_STAC4|nr:hypothetical protein S40285_02520 [Stachybotrys chlorohalonata IBT 40285]